jgi:hypothetical protein
MTTPVAGSNNGTGAPTGAPATGAAGVVTARVVLPALPTVAGDPFKVSLVNALPALLLPNAPFTPVIVSLVAAIGGAPTVVVMLVVLQFVGFNFSHTVYVMV